MKLKLFVTLTLVAACATAAALGGRDGACGHALRGYYAASRTLPCGTHVLVSYGGRSVVVTIEDRGPQSTLRDLVLSKSAFAALASTSKGVIWVHWRVQ